MELKTEFNPYPDANPALYAHLTRLIWTYVMDHYESGETSDFQAIFDLVERCIVEGDHFVREWAVIGVLEDLQGAVLRKKLPDRSFFFWFGPRTKDYWFELHRFWGTGPSASNGKQA